VRHGRRELHRASTPRRFDKRTQRWVAFLDCRAWRGLTEHVVRRVPDDLCGGQRIAVLKVEFIPSGTTSVLEE
jgi:hypothetical protein